MNKKKIFILTLIIFIILILVFLAITIRKMIILKDLNQKVAIYIDNNSYYEKIIANSEETETITEYYSKGEKAVLFLNTTIKDTGQKRKITNYYKGEKTNTYIEADDNKIALLDSNGIPNRLMIKQVYAGNNLWELFLISLGTSIRSEEYNNKKCYVLSIGKEPENYSKEYIDKETGLTVKAKNGFIIENGKNKSDTTLEYYYKFDNVDDTIFVEPDINQYKIQENI